MDLAAFRTRIKAVIGLDPAAGSEEELLLDAWVNQAVLRVLEDTKCYASRSPITTTANTGDYDLDAAILLILGWTYAYGGQTPRLYQVTPEEILDWRSSNTASQPQVTSFAVLGSNMLMLYPTPSSAGTITLYYVPRPASMTTGANDPSVSTYGGVPVEYHEAIELFALSKAADYDDDSTSQQGDRYRGLYEAEIRRVRRLMTTKTGRTPWFSLRDNSRQLVAHDRSADIRG